MFGGCMRRENHDYDNGRKGGLLDTTERRPGRAVLFRRVSAFGAVPTAREWRIGVSFDT